MSNVIDSIKVSGTVYTLSAQTEGGGKAIEAGRGISVTTGETADTVSFNLPISAGTGTGSIVFSNGKTNGKCSLAIGDNSKNPSLASEANGQTSFSCGLKTIANKDYSAAFGDRITTKNKDEFGCGSFNNSVSASTSFGDSGNTLFSVGNGTANNARHNAFEIRQNGDIYLSSGGTDIKLQDHLGGGGTVDQTIISGSTNAVAGGAVYDKIDEIEEVTAAGLNALNDKITPTVELTQAEYDALVSAGTVSADTYYIITDAQAGDLTQYWTSAQTQSAITQAVSGKQETLVSGTNIKTINNESLLGSGNIDIQGGSTYTAGRGISIANDTISFSLPISAGTGSNSIIENSPYNKATSNYTHAEGHSTSATNVYSHAEGYQTLASGQYAHAEGFSTTAQTYCHSEGYQTLASGSASHTEGGNTSTSNSFEHASGYYNVSSSASTTFGNSGNTLFSVGNGTSNNARHNAFEIRQNGDIYLNNGTSDVKLQEYLQIKVVKLTQSAYDALSPNYDSNTLYIIKD